MSLPFVPWAMKRLPCVWSYFTRECRCFQWWEGVRKTLILALSLPGKGEGLENPSAESDRRARLEPAVTLSHPRKGAGIEKPPAESEFTHRGTTQAPSLPVSKTSSLPPLHLPIPHPQTPAAHQSSSPEQQPVPLEQSVPQFDHVRGHGAGECGIPGIDQLDPALGKIRIVRLLNRADGHE